MIDQANHIVNRYYTLAQQHTLTEDEAKKQALETLAAMRYGKDGYISVNNSQPVMLMHPIKPEMDGKNFAQFTDPAGNHLFVDIVNAGNHEGGGYVDYLWAKPGSDKPVAKTSFAAPLRAVGLVSRHRHVHGRRTNARSTPICCAGSPSP